MTEEKAIKELKERIKISASYDMSEYKEVLEMAINALEEVQQYRAIGTNIGDKWINVSSSLPEVGVTVLCSCKYMYRYNNAEELYYALLYRTEDNDWIGDDGMINGTVIYWMPIPEMPVDER